MDFFFFSKSLNNIFVPGFFFVDTIEDMHDYGVYTDVVDITFDEEELEDSDVEEDGHKQICNRNLGDWELRSHRAGLRRGSPWA